MLANLTSITSNTQNSIAAGDRATLSDNFDTFLKLLTAQLANQDPLEPMDSNKFTEQLVAYSQVEQQIRTNSQLESLIAQSQASAGAAAVSYLGRSAQIESATAALTETGAQWSYSFDEKPASLRLSVRDALGREVYGEVGTPANGAQTFKWDGLDNRGRRAADGAYTLVVQAADEQGGLIGARVFTEETITGVGFGADGLMLRTASGEKPFTSIRSVRD